MSLEGIAKHSIGTLGWQMLFYSLSQSISFLALGLGFWYVYLLPALVTPGRSLVLTVTRPGMAVGSYRPGNIVLDNSILLSLQSSSQESQLQISSNTARASGKREPRSTTSTSSDAVERSMMQPLSQLAKENWVQVTKRQGPAQGWLSSVRLSDLPIR